MENNNPVVGVRCRSLLFHELKDSTNSAGRKLRIVKRQDRFTYNFRSGLSVTFFYSDSPGLFSTVPPGYPQRFPETAVGQHRRKRRRSLAGELSRHNIPPAAPDCAHLRGSTRRDFPSCCHRQDCSDDCRPCGERLTADGSLRRIPYRIGHKSSRECAGTVHGNLPPAVSDCFS